MLPYVQGLAGRGVRFSLVSFEKAERWREAQRREALRARLLEAGVEWRPLAYHRRPRLPATAYDVARGALALRAQVSREGAGLVHCRGEVALAMARLAGLPPRVRVLHDMRARFSDERVSSGSWAGGGPVDRMVRAMERANLRRADGTVVLTERARAVVAAARDPLPPLAVIPTCVDLERFTPRPVAEGPAYGLAYLGSLGGVYMAREMVDFARACSRHVPGPALFLTPQPAQARAAGAGEEWAEARVVAHEEVAGHLRRASALFFFLRPSPANGAACPTKLAEALACGLPVVCNRGIADLDELLPSHRVGLVLDELSPEAYGRAALDLRALLADPELRERCRRLAEERFGLPSGVAAYHRLYLELVGHAG